MPPRRGGAFGGWSGPNPAPPPRAGASAGWGLPGARDLPPGGRLGRLRRGPLPTGLLRPLRGARVPGLWLWGPRPLVKVASMTAHGASLREMGWGRGPHSAGERGLQKSTARRARGS